MVNLLENTIFVAMLVAFGCKEVFSIKCFQCASFNNTDCSDMLVHQSDRTVHPRECSHLYGAQYCIKTTGRYGGGIGTKRFCSSLNLGNYCNYISQPGDTLLYRSCVYTCDSDGCNGSATVSLSILTLCIAMFFTLI
ncbi:uncharacterized protein LOC103509939 isoform X2 [Diaphorina citri]|uniref:Uncharacterized protein LOC103509939 isoform X2 n=1 Tax=Diaphorina citri TaxID=121845 RepID=A0A1S3D294_DIACI|nr:uncharacterized protein LOC103509939 isoform X2 [Diaphorina citri]